MAMAAMALQEPRRSARLPLLPRATAVAITATPTTSEAWLAATTPVPLLQLAGAGEAVLTTQGQPMRVAPTTGAEFGTLRPPMRRRPRRARAAGIYRQTAWPAR